MVNLCSSGDRVSIETRSSLSLVVLPPFDCGLQSIKGSPCEKRSDLIARMQRLRGRIYLEDGAIDGKAVRNGRHRTPQDERSWHLLLQDSDGEVRGCLRAQVHDLETSLSKLASYRAASAMDAPWRHRCKNALRAEMSLAHRLGIPVVELGGLALDHTVRRSSALVKMTGGLQDLGEHLGGAIGIGTVTCRHNTSTVLRRLGGQALQDDGNTLPSYYDPQYRCEMEILKFYSWLPIHHHRRYRRLSEHLTSSFVHQHALPYLVYKKFGGT